MASDNREGAPFKKKRRGRHPRQSLLTEKLRLAVSTFTSSVGAPIIQPGGFRDFNGWLQKISQPSHRRAWLSLGRTFFTEATELSKFSKTVISDLKKDVVHQVISNVVKRSPHESVKLVSTNARRQAAIPSTGMTVMTIFESYLQVLSGVTAPEASNGIQKEMRQNHIQGYERRRSVSPSMDDRSSDRFIQKSSFGYPTTPHHHSPTLHAQVRPESRVSESTDVTRTPPWTRTYHQQQARVYTSTPSQNQMNQNLTFTGISSYPEMSIESLSSKSSSLSKCCASKNSLVARAMTGSNISQCSNMNISSLLIHDEMKRKQGCNNDTISPRRYRMSSFSTFSSSSSSCKPRLPSLSQLDEQLRQQLQKRDFY